jgi:uncharacterized delta-60 repeat protein
VQGDGKIIAGGSFTFVGSTATRRVCRINSDGTLDAAFSTGTGTGFNFDVNTVALQADGKILVGGGFTTFAGVAAMNLIRLNSSGSRDTGFLSKGMDSTVNVVAAQPDGKIVVGGAFLNYFDASGATTVRPRVARLTSAGALDPGLNSTWGNPGAIFAQLPIAGGKTLVAGLFTVLRGAAVPAHLALLNADASVDASFNSGGSGANAQIYAVLRQPDGKFLITGMFTTYNGASANRIARLNADGTRDTTFSPGAGLNFVGYTLGLLSGGRILVGGLFTMVGTTARNGVAVLNPDGSVDINFSPGSGTTAGVFCSLVQGDGKIVLGGAFTAFNGTPVGSIVRLNPDGATDTAFDTRSGAHGSVFAFGSGPEGKIVIGGTFDSYMTVPTSGLGVSVPRSGIARLNASDGSLDTTFVPVELVGFRMVSALLVQEDGRVLVRGPFDSIGGSPATAFLGRFNVDGSLDPTFAAGGFSLSDATPATMAMDDAGRVLMSANGSQAAAATRAAALPAITTQPMTQHVAVGTTGTLSVAASTVLPVRYQWSFNNAPIPGAIGATLAVTNFQSANAGTYAVTVANELGSTTSTAAVVAVGVVPTITTQPVAVSVSAGGGTSFVVVAAGLPAPTYQWQRQSAGTVGFSNVSDTGGFSGSTNATLTLTAATVALHGDQFQCIVSNGVGAPIVTVPAVLTVTSAPVITSAASAKFIVGRPGSFAMQVASFPASIWSVSGGALPPWATLNGTTGAITGTAPDATASPFVFTLTATNGIGIAATQTLTLIVQPGHSADVSPADGMLNLAELTRVIELYNTSTGTVRTGRHVVSASSVDGYAPDPGVTAGPIPTTPHTADLNRDGRLSLTELTRVIELFNTRSGTTRTGAYHAAASPIATEDGFASGP